MSRILFVLASALLVALTLPVSAPAATRLIVCDDYGCSEAAPERGRMSGARTGMARHRSNSISLRGVVAPLVRKTRAIIRACGSRVISAVRHTQIAGSGRLSLHASGRAVDISGNPKCIYRMLRGWPGGYSTDYWSVRCRGRRCPHVHVSYSPDGAEWGVRFRH